MSDCVMLACEWSDTVSGSNLVEEFRGRYSTLDEGEKLVSGRWQKFAAEKLLSLGWKATLHPKEGDIAFARGGAICLVAKIGSKPCLVAPNERIGLTFLPLHYAEGGYSWAS